MKLIIYKGIGKRVVAMAVVLQKRAARFKRKIRISFEGNIILATPTDVKVLRAAGPFIILINKIHSFVGTATGAQDIPQHTYYRVIDIKLSNTELAEGHPNKVVAVGTTALFSSAVISVRSSPEELPVYEQLEHLTNVFNTLYTDNRTEELFYTIAAMPAPTVYIAPTSGLYINEGRRYVITPLAGKRFLGTDANGDNVALCKVSINSTYADPEAEILTFPVMSYDGVDQYTPRGKGKYYNQFYVVVPIDKLLELQAGAVRGVASEVTDISNTEEEPDLVIDYYIGHNKYTQVVTQQALQNRQAQFGNTWRITEAIPTGSIPPAVGSSYYWVVGSESTIREVTLSDGSTFLLVSKVDFYVTTADGVNIPGSYPVVYLPDAVPEQEFRFCEGVNDGAYLTVASTLSGTETTVLSTNRSDEVYDLSIYWFNLSTTVSSITYRMAELSHAAVSTVIDTVVDDTIVEQRLIDSMQVDTVFNKSYVVEYINGAIAVSEDVVASNGVVSGSDSNTIDNGPIGGTAQTVFALNVSTTSSENSFLYDNTEYSYNNAYLAADPVSVSYVQTTTEILVNPVQTTTYSVSGGIPNRNLRSWWHEPEAAITPISNVQGRLIVRKEGSWFPVHIYSMYSHTSEYLGNKVFISGVETTPPLAGAVHTDDAGGPDELLVLGDKYQYEMKSMLDVISITHDSFRHAIGFGAGGTVVANASSDMSVTTHRPSGPFVTGGGTIRAPARNQNSVDVLAALQSYMIRPTGNIDVIQDLNYSQFYPYSYASLRASVVTTDNPSFRQILHFPLTDFRADILEVPHPHVSFEGQELFPAVHTGVTKVGVLHWRGLTADTDGLCVFTSTNSELQHQRLLYDYDEAAAAGNNELADSFISTIDNSITIIYNNFASASMLRYLPAGRVYTLFK